MSSVPPSPKPAENRPPDPSPPVTMPQPPPLPESIPLATAAPMQPGDRNEYQTIADTVGLVPSMRKGENKMQLIVFAVVFLLAFIVSAVTYLIMSDRDDDLGLGAVLGISAIVSAFVAGVAVILSGAVLGIRNLFRAGKR